MTLKVGDRVRYKPGAMYGIKPAQELIGVVGSVQGHTSSGNYTCFVTWDTKKRGSYYYNHELELAENGLDIMLRESFGE